MVTVVGPAGCGKSRLARELMRGWESERPDAKVLFTTGSQFAAQLAEAAVSRTIPQFQTRHRHEIDLFVCEDVHVLGPRQESQIQLLAAIDDVMSRGGVVLLTSTRLPAAISGLNRRLVNRMHGGICVEIDLPGPDSRRQLLEEFLSVESFPLTSQQIDSIIAGSAGSPRELLGVLNQLQAEATLPTGRSRTAGVNVKAVLADRQRTQELSLPEIARVTAERFGVKVSEMKGPHRGQSLSLARQTAMFLARDLAGLHYGKIGEFFQRGNHSTVIHACQKIARELENNVALLRHVQAIRDELERGWK